MLAKTISELTEENSELLTEAKKLLQGFESAFASILLEAQTSGEINKDRDVQCLARDLQNKIMGLRTYTSINHDQTAFAEMIDNAFATHQN